MSVPDVRQLAADALARVDRGAPLDLALDDALDGLEAPRDRGLAAELVRGVLQWRARYDRIIDHHAKHPRRIRAGVRQALRLGLHQILALDRVPDHAAVDQSVRLARRAGGRGQGGFVNGLLRTVLRTVDGAPDRLAALSDCFPEQDVDPVGRLAAWESHPVWLVRRWWDRYGDEAATALLRHANTPPGVDLLLLPGADAAAARDAVAAAGATPVGDPGTGTLGVEGRLSREALTDILAANRRLIVQDVSVQRATDWLLHGASGPALDMCAAPGGKTIAMRCALPPGDRVTALDVDRRRLRRLTANLERVEPGPVDVVSADGMRTPFRDGSFATVLLDGPCSGTGVLRHHPDGRWRLKPETLTANRERLTAMCREAARLLAPGGLLLYATCSLEPEEGEEVLEALCDPESGQEPGLTSAPDDDGRSVRRWQPWRDGGDGFFAARLRKEVRS